MIVDYFEKFFVKLQWYLEHMKSSNNLIQDFLKLPKEDQKQFLLKSDISVLVLYIWEFNRTEFTWQLEQELQYFLNGEEEKCTYSLGKNIPWTDIKLTLYDNNPSNDLSNHPDHDAGSMVTWWERSEEEWLQVYGKSFSLLKKLNLEFYNELNFIIQKIVPFGTSCGVHNSCSLKESVWNLYLWYTIDADIPELNNLEALIHEASHNKLNLIMHHEKIILNDKVEKYYSPYRPDARPIYGVYVWVHAIVPTIYTMMQSVEIWYVTDIRWIEKIIVYHLKNKIWMKVLKKYAKCSDLWYKIMDELDDVMKMCDQIILKTPIFKEVNFRESQTVVKQHFLDVQRNYPHLEY